MFLACALAQAACRRGLSSRYFRLSRLLEELALARGDGTEDIARRLHISTHTVRDHLKSIFDKTGVGSRNALLALLFHDHYAEPFFERVTATH